MKLSKVMAQVACVAAGALMGAPAAAGNTGAAQPLPASQAITQDKGASQQPARTAAAQRKKTAAAATAKKRPVSQAPAKQPYRYGTYFVPPPPAFMPNILPELSMMGAHSETPVEKPENPYSKYIYTRVGEEPRAIESRKGVSVWAPPQIASPQP